LKRSSEKNALGVEEKFDPNVTSSRVLINAKIVRAFEGRLIKVIGDTGGKLIVTLHLVYNNFG
jgi:hypothetical protein